MSTIETTHTEQSAAAANCTSCGARTAPDQRYCLSCGARRGETRLPFAEVTARAAAARLAPASPPPPSSGPVAVPLTWPVGAAAAALLLLALGVGVLIGNSTSKSPRVSAAAPQVITVAGGGTTGAAGSTASTTGAKSGSSTKHKKSSSSSSHANVASDKSAAKVNRQQLNNLNKLSPQQYQKQESKLPNKIQTQGKPAPIDKSKPIGGGSGSQTFK